MDPLMTGGIAVGCVLFLTLTGVPVSVALGLAGIVGLWLVGGEPLVTATIEKLPFDSLAQFSFVVIPMFVLMGVLASRAKITEDLYDACYRFLSHVRGSLLIVSVMASAGFAAISGSTIVNAAVFTRLALPQMIRYRYDPGLGAGCIAAAGTFAALIPPSIMMVIYALLTQVSIGRLLIAGVVPGILTALAYVIGILVIVRVRPDVAPVPDERFSWRQKLESLRRVGPFVLLAALVLGGIYTGVMFPSSAGAVGAIGAYVIAAYRGFGRASDVSACLRDTAVTTAALFMVLIGGLIFARYLVFSGFVTDLVSLITESGIAPYQVILAIIVMNLILGMFMDTVSVVVVTVPFLFPIVVGLGYDPIWFGIILIKLVEISAITPPVGLNLFAVMAAVKGQITTRQLYAGVGPFLMIEFVILAILVIFPEISLWLPNTMFGN